MKSLLAIGLFFFSTLSLASLSRAPFQYRARVPALAKSCLDEAAELATRLQRAFPKIKNATGRCIQNVRFQEGNDTFEINSVAVDYEAPSEISAQKFELPGTLDFGPALYPNYKACFADLAAQKNTYTQATGAAPVDASCESVSASPELGYRIQIRGAGSPQRLRVIYNSSPHRAVTDPAWSAQIVNAITDLKGVVTKVSGPNYYYYAADALPVKAQTLFAVYNESECAAQLADARVFLQELGATRIQGACHKSDFSGYSLDIVALTAKSIYNGSSEAGYFHSFNECMIEKAALPPSNYPHNAFCSTGGGAAKGYRIEVLSVTN